MNPVTANLARRWMSIGAQFLPFADAATVELPLGRLLRLSLFQVSVGLATALLIGTLNRVMIIELGLQASLVAVMVSLPLLFAPFRALVGHRSDNHRSVLGWRRVPYIWMGSMMQFGGLAIMPFALIILSGDTHGPLIVGDIAAAVAFLAVGAGLQITQTAGLALATDLAPEASRPRVVALMYVMLLVGVAGGAITLGLALSEFSQLRLIKVIQGAALVSICLNVVSLWKQEHRRTESEQAVAPPVEAFRDSWKRFRSQRGSGRFLFAVGLGTAGFSMQEIILEPYGAEILGLSVSGTTVLTALLAIGSLIAFGFAANRLTRGADPLRLAALGAVAGLAAFSAVVFASPLDSPLLFRIGTSLIGFGAGLFGVGVLAFAMTVDRKDQNGLALGSLGAVQAGTAGLAIALGGILSDLTGRLATSGALGTVLDNTATGYAVTYHLEILFLFGALVAIGPLVKSDRVAEPREQKSFGIVGLPG
jgi:BCD family chlorophyll transporter-like MFS transporter